MKNKVVLGIDLGKGITTLSIKNESTDLYSDVKIKVPSVYIITKLGELLFGEYAFNYAKINKETVYEMPRKIKMSEEFSRGVFSYTPVNFYERYFVYLKTLVERNGQEISRVVVSCFDDEEQQFLMNVMKKMKVPLYFMSKAIACTLPIIDFSNENVSSYMLCCVIDEEKIEGAFVEGGDGVIEVIALAKKSIQACQEPLKVAVDSLIETLISRAYDCNVPLEKINIVQICSETDISEDIKSWLRRKLKKQIVYKRVAELSSLGASIKAGKQTGFKQMNDFILLDVMWSNLKFYICRESGAFKRMIGQIDSDLCLPVKKQFVYQMVEEQEKNSELIITYGEQSIWKVPVYALCPNNEAVTFVLEIDFCRNVFLTIQKNDFIDCQRIHLIGPVEEIIEKEMEKITDKSIVESLLPVIDSLEWGIKRLSKEERNSPLGIGLLQSYKKWLNVIETIGLVPIAAEGCEFDPQVHHALFHVEDECIGENIIVEELQKGYYFQNKILRCSQVKVAN